MAKDKNPTAVKLSEFSFAEDDSVLHWKWCSWIMLDDGEWSSNTFGLFSLN